MSLLKSLPEPTPEPEYGTDSPTVQCDACSKSGPRHLMINLMIVCGSPGHPSLPHFQCPGSQQYGQPEHWACSLNCWRQVAHACVDEHMHILLTALHQQLGLIPEE